MPQSILSRFAKINSFYDKKNEEDFRDFTGTTTLLTGFIILPFLLFFLIFAFRLGCRGSCEERKVGK